MLVEHHIKYKELHGVDETVWMEAGKHKTLHNRLRREGKCNVPVDILQKISRKAQSRTDKCKERNKNYIKKMYESNREYARQNYRTLVFNERLSQNIRLKEQIRCNLKTNKIYISSIFEATGNHKLIIVEV